jgi:hypothetical protein
VSPPTTRSYPSTSRCLHYESSSRLKMTGILLLLTLSFCFRYFKLNSVLSWLKKLPHKIKPAAKYIKSAFHETPVRLKNITPRCKRIFLDIKTHSSHTIPQANVPLTKHSFSSFSSRLVSPIITLTSSPTSTLIGNCYPELIRRLTRVSCQNYHDRIPWRGIPQKQTVTRLVKKFPAIYGTWKFIAGFTQVEPLDPIDSISHPNPWRYILILLFCLFMCLSHGRFPLGFPVKSFARISRVFHVCYTATACFSPFIKINSEFRALLSYSFSKHTILTQKSE